MNILKKTIIVLILAVNSSIFCEEVKEEATFCEDVKEEMKNHYNYWGFGVGIPTILSIKFGHREQINHHGFEYGMGITPLICITEAHVFGSYLYYPRPHLDGQTYFGLGLRAGGFLEVKREKFVYVAPGFMVGREYLNDREGRRFVQVAFGSGGLTSKGFLYFPSISLTFGYSF